VLNLVYFAFAILTLIIGSGCTDGLLSTTNLGLTSNYFVIEQDGAETSYVKVNLDTEVARFHVQCMPGMNELLVSFDGGGTYTSVSSLNCTGGLSVATISFAQSPSVWPEDSSVRILPALIKAKGPDGETVAASMSFIKPQFLPATLDLKISGGSAKTNQLSPPISMHASQEAGGKLFSPNRVYLTSVAGCGSGGQWYTYAPIVIGPTLSAVGAPKYLYAKFRDEANNVSDCIFDSIEYDADPPIPLGIAINGGAPQSPLLDVSLEMRAYGDPVEMLVAGNEDCSGDVEWEPYVTSKPWRLLGPGINFVSVMFRDDAGNESECIQDSIVYDTDPPVTPTRVALAGDLKSLGNKSQIEIEVAPVLDGDTARIYTSQLCDENEFVSEATARLGKAFVPVELQTDGSYTFYAKVVDVMEDASECSAVSAVYTYDSTPPRVVNVTSSLADGDYVDGMIITIDVVFSEPVKVLTGSRPTLELDIYGKLAPANYLSGSGTNTLRFAYTISEGDVDNHLDYSSENALAFEEGDITDAAGNQTNAILPAPQASGSLSANKTIRINYEAKIQAVYGPSDSDYFATNALDFLVKWNSNVVITGTPRLRIKASGNTFYANYSSARSQQSESIFSVTVPPNLNAPNGIIIEALELNGGTIKNSFPSPHTANAILTMNVLTLTGVKLYSGTPPQVGFASPAPLFVDEVQGQASITLTSSAAFSEPITVSYRLGSYETATNADHSLTQGQITIPAGQTTANINFQITNDSLAEGLEGFSVLLTDATPGRLSANVMKTVYIRDDETRLSANSQDSIIEMVSGTSHSCALYSSKKVHCWGSNSNGQLGGGTTTRVVKAVEVPLENVTKITAGGNHTCAISNGSLYCWGLNSSGQLGIGNTTSQSSPKLVSNLSQVLDVSAGSDFTCAIYNPSYRNLVCWGSNSSGRLGDGTTSTRTTPSASAPILQNVDQLTTGADHSCALSAGSVRCWGYNYSGQLGNDSATSSTRPALIVNDVSFPTDDAGITDQIVQVAASIANTCARTLFGSVYCWGSYYYLGTGSGSSVFKLQSPATIVSGATHLYSGPNSNQFCVKLTNGSVSCWGSGQFFDSSIFRSTPSAFSISNLEAISVGNSLLCHTASNSFHPVCRGVGTDTSLFRSDYYLSLATKPQGISRASLGTSSGTGCTLHSTGLVECINSPSPAGDKSANSRLNPVNVFKEKMTQVATGNGHACAIREDKTLWCWGSNSYGGVGFASTASSLSEPRLILSDVIDIGLSGYSSCALKLNGKLYCWGPNSSGQLGIGSRTISHTCSSSTACSSKPIEVSLQGVTSFSTSYLSLSSSQMSGHACAISNGATYCWGANNHQQLGDASGQTQNSPIAVLDISGDVPVQVETGIGMSCLRYSNGKVRCWGLNSSGQLGLGNTTNLSIPYHPAVSNSSSLSVSIDHACSVSATGTLSCWGANTNGKLGNNSTTNVLSALAVGTNVDHVWSGSNATCFKSKSGVTSCSGALSGLFFPKQLSTDYSGWPILGTR
jgi:alpha-tubulin suppressor-like RCC1 family protein